MHKFSEYDIWIYVRAGRYYLAECNKQCPCFLLWFQKLKILNEEWWEVLLKKKTKQNDKEWRERKEKQKNWKTKEKQLE